MNGRFGPWALDCVFPAAPSAVGQARAAVGQALEEWGFRDPGGVAVLLTSEIVTNAMRHTSRDVELAVRLVEGDLEVAVSDDHPDDPVVLDGGPEGEGGRGMRLVSALADDWGVIRPHEGRKAVWFRIRLEEPGRPADPGGSNQASGAASGTGA